MTGKGLKHELVEFFSVFINEINGDHVMENLAVPYKLVHTGMTEVSMPFTGKFLCAMDATNFPFDKHLCRMELTSWTFDDNMINLTGENLTEMLKSITFVLKF